MAASALPLLGRPALAQSTWTNAGDGNWNNNANWDTAAFPDAADAVALFDNANPAADSTITLTAPIVLGRLQIDNPTNSTITGESITFDESTSAQIQFNDGHWTIASDIVMDTDLTLTGGSDGTIGGVIADGAASSLIKDGSGTVVLAAANTFTGSTQIDDGTLQLEAVDALGSTSAITVNGTAILRNNAPGDVINNTAALTLNDTARFDLNGDFETIGSLAGEAGTTVTLGADTLHTGINGLSTAYDGVISGIGGLDKSGAGTFSLNGDSTYTGPTTIMSGRLDVNGSLQSHVTATSGSIFGGTGSVPSATINGGATVAPGNSIGTLTIAGNGMPAFTQAAGSTYEVEINDGGTTPGVNNDLIDLTGAGSTADLAGTVSVLDTTGGIGDNYAAGTTYTILQTANPTGVTGAYDGVIDNLLIRDALLIHNDDSVQMQLLRIDGDYEANAQTRNQQNVGRVLDDVNALAGGDLGDVLDQMVQLAPNQMPAVLDQLGGEIHAAAAGSVVLSTSRFTDMISRRLRSNSQGELGIYGPAAAPAAPMLLGSTGGQPRVDLTDGGDFVVRAQGVGSPAFGSAYGGFPTSGPPLGGIWAGGYGLSGDVDGDGNGNPFDYDMYGTVFGIEQQLAPALLMGLVGGYSRSQLDMNSPRSDADIDSYHAGLYGHLTEGLFYSSAVVAYGYQQYDATRQINIPGPMPISRTARADYDGQELVAYVEKGLNLSFLGMRVQPLVGLQYIDLERDAFSETGAGDLNLRVNQDHVNSLRLSAGGRIAPDLPGGFWGAIIPEFRGRWVHEFMDDDQTISASFAGAPGNNFAVTSAELGRNFGVVGAGLTAQLGPMVNIFVDYDFTFSSALEAHAGSGGLEFLW